MTVRLDKVAKSFGAVKVLHDLDLDVAEGEFLVLLGASGSGKTTALRMIAGLETVTSGMHHDRRPRRHQRAAEEPRRGDGVPVLRALPAQDRRRKHRLSPEDQGPAAGRARRGGARRRRAGAARRAARPLSAPAFRRPAPACGAGARHGQAAESVPDGRAALQPRRQAARPHARRAEAHAAFARHHHDLRHPRPGRGDDAGAPRGAAGRRQADAARHAAHHLQRPGQSVRRRLHRLAANEHDARRAGGWRLRQARREDRDGA